MLKVSTSELAALLGVTETHIARLAKDQIVVRLGRGEYDGPASVKGYLAAKLKEQAGALEKLDESDFEKHRARLYRARADREERKSLLEAGKVLDADAFEYVWNEQVSAARAKLLAMPPRLAPRMLMREDVNEVNREITDEVHEALQELHEYDARPIIERWYRENGGAESGPENEDAVEASSETDD